MAVAPVCASASRQRRNRPHWLQPLCEGSVAVVRADRSFLAASLHRDSRSSAVRWPLHRQPVCIRRGDQWRCHHARGGPCTRQAAHFRKAWRTVGDAWCQCGIVCSAIGVSQRCDMISLGPGEAGQLEGRIKARTLRGGRVVELVDYLLVLDTLRRAAAMCRFRGTLVD